MSRWRMVGAIVLVTVGVAFGLLLAVDTAVDRAVLEARQDLEAVAVASARQGRESSVAGCERSKDDRLDSMKGWRMALQARTATARNPEVDTKERLTAAAAAALYKDVIAGFKSRIVECTEAFPPVSIERVREVLKEGLDGR